MEQGWLQDRYKRRAFTLEELTTGMYAALTLVGKPKVIILQQYLEGTSRFISELAFVHSFSIFCVCVLALITNSDRFTDIPI